MELAPLRNSVVGLPGVSGLSVEQRKRLTIGVELVANPGDFDCLVFQRSLLHEQPPVITQAQMHLPGPPILLSAATTVCDDKHTTVPVCKCKLAHQHRKTWPTF